ncbi:MAG: hypothetical protein GY781_14980 [Gammaproteobacteria bacterium]|nr:hypothetical protein [Gammaproteobacteria bacterium]
MEEFPYYGLSWFFYLIVTASFILFSAWKTRTWSKWTRVPLLSFIAAMALTPGLTVPDESWWSPAAIIMIFEMDQKGLQGIWPSLISIITVWLILMVGTILTRWLPMKKLSFIDKLPLFQIPLMKKIKSKARKQKTNEQPDLKEPEN